MKKKTKVTPTFKKRALTILDKAKKNSNLTISNGTKMFDSNTKVKYINHINFLIDQSSKNGFTSIRIDSYLNEILSELKLNSQVFKPILISKLFENYSGLGFQVWADQTISSDFSYLTIDWSNV